ncbi:hypothetical protein KEM48_005042 [Puccinia striiformis f. sp. tritici PST-130]|nr:hypothetical protein KEM48_005042 [Puccinia striiformis f. sp. tritici PST-130]
MKLHCAVIARDLRSSSSTLRWEIAPVAELTALLGYGNHVDNSSNANRTHPLKLKLQLHSFNSPPPTKQKHLRTTNMLFTTQIVALTLAFAAHTGASTPSWPTQQVTLQAPRLRLPGPLLLTSPKFPQHTPTSLMLPRLMPTPPKLPRFMLTPPKLPRLMLTPPKLRQPQTLPPAYHPPLLTPCRSPVHGDMSSGKCMCPPPPTCVSFVDPKFAADVVSPISSGITPPITNSTVDDDTPLGNNTEGNSTSTGTPSVLNSFSLAGFMAAGAVALAL